IKGTKYAGYFKGIWGCRFSEQDGQISHVMNAISYTEKTKYIYAINKGVDVRAKPYAVNEAMDPQNRRVPFTNMIYIGDGLTDVPCFSMLLHFGGKGFGVFDPRKADAPKKAWQKLVTPKRVLSMNSPRYGADQDLGALLRAAVSETCLNIEVKSKTALA